MAGGEVTVLETFTCYWNYQVWHLTKGEVLSGGLADYLLATGGQVEEVATGPAEDADGDGVPDGTVAQVEDWVGGSTERAALALEAEEAKGDNARSTLVAALYKVLTS